MLCQKVCKQDWDDIIAKVNLHTHMGALVDSPEVRSGKLLVTVLIHYSSLLQPASHCKEKTVMYVPEFGQLVGVKVTVTVTVLVIIMSS